MASETFVSAMMLITGVVAASILIVAVLPMIWGMVGTFSSASAATDRSMRTDFKIVTTYAKYLTAITGPPAYPAGANVTVWMKNVGTTKISAAELNMADVYVGKSDNFARALKASSVPYRANLQWWWTLTGEPFATANNNFWDPGETLQIDTFVTSVSSAGQSVYFQFTLPSGVSRSVEFTSS
jgi:flagellar protein FlaG